MEDFDDNPFADQVRLSSHQARVQELPGNGTHHPYGLGVGCRVS